MTKHIEQNLAVDRRRFLTLTASGVTATALVGVGGLRPAFAPASREPNNTAAAPSTMPDELPA